MTIRILSISALLALAIGPGCSSTSADSSTDNYWEITFSTSASQPKANQFWRTHQAASNVEVYMACDGENATPMATATGNEDGTWTIKGDFGDFVATITTPGKLTLTQTGALFGTGQRIAKPTCQNGFPLAIVPIEATEGERSFAGVSGDASHLEDARNVALPTIRTPAPTAPTIPDTSVRLPNGDSQACKTTANPLAAVRSLGGIPTLGENTAIWPGALLQGRDFAKGVFTPITIARAGSILTVTGATFSGNGTSSRKVSVMTRANVVNAINSLLQQPIATAEASVSYRVAAVYNNDQIAYAAGLDGRFANELNRRFPVDPNSGKKYALFTFLQTYYTITMEDPETAYSVFRDGTDLKDPENQIGADNPPLYVRDVGYGRMILFLATSDYDSNAMVEALNALADGKSGGSSISGGLSVSHATILQNSTVSYFVIGGDAIATLGAMGTIGGISNIYDTLKEVIAAAKLTQVSEFSKGVPVNYTLAYLTSRATASMGFATDYNSTSCSIVPKQNASFSLSVHCVDDSTNITLSDEFGNNIQQLPSSGPLPWNIDLDFFMPNKSQTYILRLTLYNVAGPLCLDFMLTRRQYDPSFSFTGLNDATGGMIDIGPTPRVFPPPEPSPMVKKRGWGPVGTVVDYRVRLNSSTSEVTVIQGR